MSVRIALAMLMGWAIVGCQPHKQERKHAPTGAHDVGILLEANDASVVDRVLNEFPEAQVRQLNPKHGIYEIFGVSREKLKQAAPDANLTENRYYEFKPFSTPAPDGLEIEGLRPCVASDDGPTAVATVKQPQVNGNSFTVDLGQKVTVSAALSKAGASHPGNVTTALVVMPPSASQAKEHVVIGGETEIDTDALGAYQVYVVAQDSGNVCALDAVQFVATANRPYRAVAAPGSVIDLSRFGHLKQINAEESWARSTGEGITIAIVDTGVNYLHPLLSANMAVNPAETAGDGRDGDGNGFIDDVVGYDFVNSDPFPYDDDSHGTHVAGLAAGLQFGMAHGARILAVKALTSLGGDAGSIASAIIYAVDRGAKIINMSLGGAAPAPHPLMVRAAEYAREHNVLIVAAAGNGDPRTGLGFDIDTRPVFPAAMDNPTILTVAAADSHNALTTYSNFGKRGVDVTAPGGMGREPLISTAFENPRGGQFIGMSGTSMASPVVSGIAAQVWALNPRLSALQVKEILIKSGQEFPELKRVTVSGRMLNALAAVSTSNSPLD